MKKFDKSLLDKYVGNSPITCEKHPHGDLYIYGYYTGMTKKEIVWDNINIHCRGLIINGEGHVIARPFKKFFTFRNYVSPKKILLSEKQIISVPTGNFRILEKVDGSMATLYWLNDVPYLATQRSFLNLKATTATKILHEKYPHTFSFLKKDRTYVFEAIYPECRVAVDYGERRDLVLIGILDNQTGNDLPLEDIGFPIAKDFTEEYGHIKNFNELSNLNIKNTEGFVLTYENGVRVKIKFPWFKEAHELISRLIVYNTESYNMRVKLFKIFNLEREKLSNVNIWQNLKEGQSIDSLLLRIPEEFYSCGFNFWFEEIKNSLEKEFLEIRNESKSLTEKEIWNKIKPKQEIFFEYDKIKSLPQYDSFMWRFFEKNRSLFQ